MNLKLLVFLTALCLQASAAMAKVYLSPNDHTAVAHFVVPNYNNVGTYENNQMATLYHNLKNELAKMQSDPNNCGCALKEYVTEYLELFPSTDATLANVQTYRPEQVKVVAKAACDYLTGSIRKGFNPIKFKESIANQIGVNPNDKDINTIISNFLNQYKNQMICLANPTDNSKRDMHLYKYALLRGVIDLYDEILFDDEEFSIDFNAVEIVEGKPETLLDYIDKRLTKESMLKDTLKGIRMDVVDLGGKTAQQLIDSGEYKVE